MTLLIFKLSWCTFSLFNVFWRKWNVKYPSYENITMEVLQHLKIITISNNIWSFSYDLQESNKIFSQNFLISNTTQKLCQKSRRQNWFSLKYGWHWLCCINFCKIKSLVELSFILAGCTALLTFQCHKSVIFYNQE